MIDHGHRQGAKCAKEEQNGYDETSLASLALFAVKSLPVWERIEPVHRQGAKCAKEEQGARKGDILLFSDEVA